MDQIDYIIQEIAQSVVKRMNTVFSSSRKAYETQIKALVNKYVTSHETYVSLIGGGLRGHFGLPRGSEENRLKQILSILTSHVRVMFYPFVLTGFNINGGMTIDIDPKVYDVLFVSNPGLVTTEKGQVLPWLEWLLSRGPEYIISDYHVLFELGKGRSGQAIMVPKGRWSVPPGYAGTYERNWFTRSLNNESFILEVGKGLEEILKTL